MDKLGGASVRKGAVARRSAVDGRGAVDGRSAVDGRGVLGKYLSNSTLRNQGCLKSSSPDCVNP